MKHLVRGDALTDGGDRPVVLVVEDEIFIRLASADWLRDAGCDVIEAATYEEAPAVLHSDDVSPELVLGDVGLTGEGNGFALRAWVRARRPEVRIVLAGSIEAAADICDDGPHLARPYDPQGVADHVRQLLAIRERARN